MRARTQPLLRRRRIAHLARSPAGCLCISHLVVSTIRGSDLIKVRAMKNALDRLARINNKGA